MLRNQAIVAGVGESRIGKVPGVTALELCAEAARRALADAGLGIRDIDGLLTAYSMTAPYPVFYGALAEFMGLTLRYGAELTAGGGSSGVMIRDAALAVVSGRADAVLVVSGDNRATGMGRDNAVAALAAWGHPYYEHPYGGFIPAYYALIAQRYMHEYGATSEDLARVAVTQRASACRHPNAHMKTPITLEDVLASKPIAEPLKLLDCCLISDAAGALLVTRAERAADLPQKPVYLLGAGEAFTHEHILAAPSLLDSGARRSAEAAYAMAGLGPQDIDLAMLYDCFTITPILLAEDCGFAARGAAAELWQDDRASIEGRFPINTHGGMLSHAHAGATGGLFESVEAVRQLRGGEGARQAARHATALVHVEGGILSNHATLIYGAQPV
ncbi:MAG TPA: thiolase family protein [Burkholderiales bacterium]|nr:thiolase family protein [Burkholderiales bacterium]